MPYITGRQESDAGLYLAQLLKDNPRFYAAVAQSLDNLRTGEENITPPYAVGENTDIILDDIIDRLADKRLLISGAESIGGPATIGLYKEGEKNLLPVGNTPDTAFVELFQFDGMTRSPKELAMTTLHEALLHGGGQRHQQRKSGGRILDFLGIDYEDTPWETKDSQYIGDTNQDAYAFEEIDLFEQMLSTPDPTGRYPSYFGLIEKLYGRPVKEEEHYPDWFFEVQDYFNVKDD